MARKAGSKNVWIDGEIHSAFKKKILEEGWTWGLTKKLESVLQAYIKGEVTAPSSLTGFRSYDVRGADVTNIPLPTPEERERRTRREKA